MVSGLHPPVSAVVLKKIHKKGKFEKIRPLSLSAIRLIFESERVCMAKINTLAI